MTLLFFDGMDHYNTLAQGQRKWTLLNGRVYIIEGSGRLGTNCLKLATEASHTSGTMSQTLPGNYSTLIAGVAFQYVYGGGTMTVLSFCDSATTQVTLNYNAGTQKLDLSSGLTSLGSTADALPFGIFTYVELKITFGNPGSYEVRFNGGVVPVLSGTGLTIQTANSYANKVVSSVSGGLVDQGYCYYDDFYVCNDSGSLNNDFLGDIRIETIRPSGAGYNADFTASPAVANYLNVDDTYPDDDTTYNESDNVGDIDCFAFGNLASTAGTIYGIQTLTCDKKIGGNRQARHIVRISGSNYESSDMPFNTDYLYNRTLWEEDPSEAPGTQFTIAKINGAEFGYKIES